MELAQAVGTVFCADCVELMGQLPEQSVDLVLADPPYNLQWKEGLRRPEGKALGPTQKDWDAFASLQDYDAFTIAWLEAARRVMRPDASLMCFGRYHNIYRVGYALQNMGFWVVGEICVEYTNPMPNFRGARLTSAHDTVIWASRSRSAKYTYRYQEMKAENGGKQLRDVWTFPVCRGKERIMRGDQKAHATQKSEALVDRLVRMATHPGDVVLDPFAGVGTTPAVCQKTGRSWIAVDTDADYCEIARQRVGAIQ